jgi:hypothetical protein
MTHLRASHVTVVMMVVAASSCSCRSGTKTGFRADPSSIASASSRPQSVCANDAARHEARASELQAFLREDQADRAHAATMTEADWVRVAQADRRRRMRVGEIFGEGCMSTAADFAAGALIFQHGDMPEHYLQAFFWSSRAVDLGDASQREMMALSVDRYLIATGRKQLFGTQAQRPKGERCYCLPAVEPSFPDDERARFTERLAARERWVASMNAANDAGACPVQCTAPLDASPRGSVPGMW